MVLKDSIALHAKLRPQKLAVNNLADERRWTYAELDRDVAKFAGALQNRGIAAGDRIAVLARNAPETILIQAACARLGAALIPLNWRLTRSELRLLLDDSMPTLVFGDDLLEEKGIDGETLTVFFEEVKRSKKAKRTASNSGHASLILYTSGTSGRPKGALLSEYNIEESAINFSLLTDVSSGSTVLCDAPLYHVIGMVANVRSTLQVGGTVLVSDGFDPERTFHRLADSELAITHYACVPQMAAALRALPDFDPEKLRDLHNLVTGGAPHPPVWISQWIHDGITLTNGYGMTEAGTVFNMPMDRTINLVKAGSVGIPTHRLQIRIVDETGRDVPEGIAGELLVCGGSVTKGYWRRERESREAFLDGKWFRTGDIARRDTDGFYWVVDRRKDMFISGGENVYPAEVEAAIAQIHGVAESAVVGTPDEQWGEVGHLFWVEDRSGEVDDRVILERLSALLGKFKIPKHMTKVDSLPRNGAGKVHKHELVILSKEIREGQAEPEFNI